MDDRLSPETGDVVVGAAALARVIYGKDDPKSVRAVYANPLGLSIFKHAGLLAGIPSTLRREVAEIEQRAREARKAREVA
jgi:hypothetical protein